MIAGRLQFAGETHFSFRSAEVGKIMERKNLPCSHRHVKGQEL